MHRWLIVMLLAASGPFPAATALSAAEGLSDQEVLERLTTGDGRFTLDDLPIGSWSIGPAAVRDKAGKRETADFSGLDLSVLTQQQKR